jgi:hypothetical protein
MDTSAAGSSIEIRIRPLLWPFSTMIGVAVMLWVAWKMASLPLSIPRKVVTIVVMTDFVGLLASIFIATELITVGDQHLTIRRELFGIGFSKTFRLRSISNPRYQPTPWAANRGPLQSIVFNNPIY